MHRQAHLPYNSLAFLVNALLILLCLTTMLGCERKPEDLEVWRPSVAGNGLEKLQEWIASPKEPIAVRVRAAEILIEEDYAYAVDAALGKAEAADRSNLITELVPVVLKWYDAQDATVENYEKRASKQILGKEGAFYLYKYATTDADKTKLETALLDWMSKEMFVRDQMGTIRFNQIAEALGPKGAEPLLKALEDPTNKQNAIASDLRKIKNPELDKRRADILMKMGEAQLPKLDKDLEVALLEETHDAIVPLLIKLVNNVKVDGGLRDAAHQKIGKLQGNKALGTYLNWVRKGPDNLRWVSIQSIAETQGKVGLVPMLAALPEKGDYGAGDDPDSFERDAGRLCMQEVKNMKANLEPVFIKAIKTGTTPAKALSLRCLQEIKTTSASKEAATALIEDQTPIPAWGELKTLGALAQQTAKKLK